MTLKHYPSYLEKSIILCLFFFSLIFATQEKIADIFIRIAFLLILIYSLKKSSIHFNWNYYKPYLLPLIIIYLVVFFLSFLGTNFSRSILIYEAWIKIMIPFLAVILFDLRQNTVRFLFITLLFTLFCNNLYAIYQFIFFNIDRVNGFNNNIIVLSNFLLIQLPIFLLLSIKKCSTIYFRIFYILLFCTAAFTLLANGTRMVWFIIIIDILLLNFLLIKNWRKKLILTFCFIILLTSLYNFNKMIYTRVNSINIHNVSIRGHYFYMQDGYRLFLNNLYFGVGLGNFQTAILNQDLISTESKENLKHDIAININGSLVIPHAHNDLIMFLSQFGILGGILYILFYGSIIFFTFRSWQRKNNFIDLAMLLININFFLHGLDDYNFFNLKTMTIYLFIWSLYIKYNIPNTNFSVTKAIKKIYIIFPYIFILFIVLFRIISRYLLK